MSLRHLEAALEDIQALIAITKQDIIDIKLAKNEAIFSRMQQKEELVSSFVKKKEDYAQSIKDKLQLQYPNKTFEDLSTQERQELFGQDSAQYTTKLQEQLEELKGLNYLFGKLSLGVYEFYSSLLKAMIPVEERGYSKSVIGSSFLKAEA